MELRERSADCVETEVCCISTDKLLSKDELGKMSLIGDRLVDDFRVLEEGKRKGGSNRSDD